MAADNALNPIEATEAERARLGATEIWADCGRAQGLPTSFHVGDGTTGGMADDTFEHPDSGSSVATVSELPTGASVDRAIRGLE